MSQRTTKSTIRLVRPAKTQISLRIRTVWSESSPIACAFYSFRAIPRNKREPLPYWVDVQTEVSICWSHRPFCRFCRALAHIIRIHMSRNVSKRTFSCATNKDINQPAHPHSLSKSFVVRMKNLSILFTVKILIRLRECAGWSESSLGAQIRMYVF